TEVGGHTIIDLGNGDTVTLHNVSVDDIQDHPSNYFLVH
ncbi:MAG: hemolysin expression modulating protein, partial [Rhizobiales bacterium 24-66-13]